MVTRVMDRERDTAWGFRIAMVLFAFLIPVLFAVAVMLSPRGSVVQGGEQAGAPAHEARRGTP
jgi:hypothetical protein